MSRALAWLAALATGMLLALAGPASAAVTLETEAFILTYVNGSSPGDWRLSVAAQTPLTTSISLDTLNGELQYWPAIDETGTGTVNGSAHWSVLAVDVKPGYRVTGVSVHALAYGELVAGQLEGYPPGSADNRASLAWTLTAPGGVQPFGYQAATFQGLRPFALDSGPLSLDGSFRLDLSASVWSQAYGTGTDGNYAASMALASIGNALLNVQVAAIPEPATYAMLLGGLGLLGGAALRRGERRPADSPARL
ncbi:putative secreted protein with PEP-CTERM sorting signal [Pseudoduganella lurida]|uniref:Putative secreted protein with PEP-CTERM sorting signal n=1 Tax=Pseudoduganella lurida TaxID=1036180 RepID=A0A562RLM1_9BURK|nr:PEP-CTERM sorting domain-containing protein [Pseudoduganella lurida]TWI69919.1 putative secreted protein with PEP-CTERM sorting signal [Pseudoduganella lurida]